MGLAAYSAFAEYIAVKVKFCWSLNKLEEKFERENIFKIGTLIEPLGFAYNGIFFQVVDFIPGHMLGFVGQDQQRLMQFFFEKLQGEGK